MAEPPMTVVGGEEPSTAAAAVLAMPAGLGDAGAEDDAPYPAFMRTQTAPQWPPP